MPHARPDKDKDARNQRPKGASSGPAKQGKTEAGTGRGVFRLPQDHDPYDPKNAESGGFGMGGTNGSGGGFGVGGQGPQTGSFGSQADYGRGKTPGEPGTKPLTGPASESAKKSRAARKAKR